MSEPSASYQCGKCGATDCKLWRPRITKELWCTNCAAKNQGIDKAEIDDRGIHVVGHCEFKCIGSLFPAVENPCGGFFPVTPFGVITAPKEALAQWKELPTFPV